MTISIQITNNESPDDMSKELVIETCRTEDWSLQQTRALKGGESTTVTVHSMQGLRLSERFVDTLQREGRPVRPHRSGGGQVFGRDK